MGRVIVGGDSYPNSWLPEGKTIRQVVQRCTVKCQDHERLCSYDAGDGHVRHACNEGRFGHEYYVRNPEALA